MKTLPFLTKVLCNGKAKHRGERQKRQAPQRLEQGRRGLDEAEEPLNTIEQSAEWQSSLYVNFIAFEKSLRLSPQRKSMVDYEKLWNSVEDDKPGHLECAIVDGEDTADWLKVKTG